MFRDVCTLEVLNMATKSNNYRVNIRKDHPPLHVEGIHSFPFGLTILLTTLALDLSTLATATPLKYVLSDDG